MNYLQLVNDFLIETEMDDQQATVVDLLDDPLRATVWVRDAWLEIQRARNDWSFRWAEGNFDTIAAQREYTLTELGRVSGDIVNLSTLRIIAEKKRLDVAHYNKYEFMDSTGMPTWVSQKPNKNIGLYYIPDAAYTINFDYYSAPVTLADNADTPTLESAYHKAIVWLAVKNYAREQGGEWRGLYQAAQAEYLIVYHNMVNSFTPKMGRKVGL